MGIRLNRITLGIHRCNFARNYTFEARLGGKKELVLLLTQKAHYAKASLSRLLLTGEQVFC